MKVSKKIEFTFVLSEKEVRTLKDCLSRDITARRNMQDEDDATRRDLFVNMKRELGE